MAATTAKKTRKINDDLIINVKSNRFGLLTYINKKSGEEFEWENSGDVIPMTMYDLRAMKNSQAVFFKDNWIFVIGTEDDNIQAEDVYKGLMVTQYYKNIINPDNYDSVCGWTESEIKEKVPLLTSGAKENLIVALNDFVSSGTLDSLRRIKAFETVLGCELNKPE